GELLRVHRLGHLGRRGAVEPGQLPVELHRGRDHGEGLRLRLRLRRGDGGGFPLHRAAPDTLPRGHPGVVLRAAGAAVSSGIGVRAMGHGRGLGRRRDQGGLCRDGGLRLRRRCMGASLLVDVPLLLLGQEDSSRDRRDQGGRTVDSKHAHHCILARG
ncbi:unnamed protein product, partial [Ectocarpus fasciculatus]